MDLISPCFLNSLSIILCRGSFDTSVTRMVSGGPSSNSLSLIGASLSSFRNWSGLLNTFSASEVAKGHQDITPLYLYCRGGNIRLGKYLVNEQQTIINPAPFSVGVVTPWKLMEVVISPLIETLQWFSMSMYRCQLFLSGGACTRFGNGLHPQTLTFILAIILVSGYFDRPCCELQVA